MEFTALTAPPRLADRDRRRDRPLDLTIPRHSVEQDPWSSPHGLHAFVAMNESAHDVPFTFTGTIDMPTFNPGLQQLREPERA